ncbi:hypothetical protein BM477_05635 [Boudabousia marimammalium]|uniref:Uncharacterized protein n=1 Tax=Boudabousia marimammalium TaxID=156892 RepID=A0A1Q5PML3_9ACTO|nr:hypothetical protein BM477_05635 [Boudabousia marimammalium]
MLGEDAKVDEKTIRHHELPAGLPLHYGDLYGEQERLAKGEAVTVLPHGVISVSGPQRGEWLTKLCTQKFDDLVRPDGTATSSQIDKYWRHALWLDPKGHISFMAWGMEMGDQILLVTQNPEGLREHLERFKLRTDVTITDLSDEMLVLGDLVVREITPDLGQVKDLPGYVVSGRDPWPDVVEGGTAYTGALPDIAHPGERQKRRFTVVRSQPETWQWLRSLGSGFPGSATPPEDDLAGALPWRYLAGFLAWEAMRVIAWKPSVVEVDERSIPHELDLLRTAVHLRKGCYSGQETVARVVNLGRPPRRLVLLHIDGSEGTQVSAGTPIMLEGKVCGIVTTSASHYEAGPIALGLLKRAAPEHADYRVAGQAAAATTIVTPEGRSLASPQQRPGIGLNRTARHYPIL